MISAEAKAMDSRPVVKHAPHSVTVYVSCPDCLWEVAIIPSPDLNTEDEVNRLFTYSTKTFEEARLGGRVFYNLPMEHDSMTREQSRVVRGFGSPGRG